MTPPLSTSVILPAEPRAARRLALRGDLLDFTGDPGWQGAGQPAAARWRPDHWLLVQDGVIADALPAADHTPAADWDTVDHSGQLLLPGFIDT
ncbi:MAG: guanine deaminase GuaD, partial [Pseudomonadota bacterium]